MPGHPTTTKICGPTPIFVVVGCPGLVAVVHVGDDAWAPDNNEDLRTYSDQPGVDRQRTVGASVRAGVPLGSLRLLSITALSTTDMEYSFDGDWGNAPFWAAAPYAFDPDVEGFDYQFFDDMDRERRTWTQELRLTHGELPLGGTATVGAFVRDLTEETAATGYLFGGDAFDLVNTFDIGEVALYAEHRRPLTPAVLLTATLRADRNRSDYDGRTNGGSESASARIANAPRNDETAARVRALAPAVAGRLFA